MSESKHNEEAPAAKEKTSKKRSLRTVTEQELQQILQDHKLWLDSNQQQGKKANLSKTDLKGRKLAKCVLAKADLGGAELSGADLFEADLREADLFEAQLRDTGLFRADLRGANLKGCNLVGVTLSRADLRDADVGKTNLQNANLIHANCVETSFLAANMQGAQLRGANAKHAYMRNVDFSGAMLRDAILCDAELQDSRLHDAVGLRIEQLAGANVSGATLPKAIASFEGLQKVQEASKNARTLFVSMLLACVYALLTVATTQDVQFVTNSSTSPLPILNAQIPIVGFYLVAPLMLLVFATYFHLYLQRLWEALARLPAIFPDGSALDEKAYPWMLNGMVCTHFTHLQNNRPALFQLQSSISVLLAWWAVPVTLLFFLARYLPRQDWGIGTIFQVLLILASVVLALLFQAMAASTLRQEISRHFKWKEASKDVRYFDQLKAAAGYLILALGLGGGLVLLLFGFRGHAVLTEVNVSQKPQHWDGVRLHQVKGAQLSKSRLRNARAERAFLVKADLRGSQLQGAKLNGADLRHANFLGANLKDTSFQGASLRNALFSQKQLSDLKKGQADLHQLTCLPRTQKSGKSYVQPALRCHLWHRMQGGSYRGTRPRHCPSHLRGPILAFEKHADKALCRGSKARHARHHKHKKHHGHKGHGHKKHGHHGGHGHHHGLRHDFSDVKRWVKRFEDPKRTKWQKPKEVIRHMQIRRGMTVADIGAGTGYFLPYLHHAVGTKGQVLALDLAKTLVQHMNTRAQKAGWKNVKAIQVKPTDPQLKANSVDRILIVNTWHHISHRIAYAKKLVKALKPGGALYIVDFTMEARKGPRKNHRLKALQVQRELDKAGFASSMALKESLPDQYIVKAIVKK